MKQSKYLLASAMFLLIVSCATNHYAAVDGEVLNGKYGEAVETHEKKKTKLYNGKSVILYLLDSGMLNHFAGNYDVSITQLQDGERAIGEAYTKSVGEALAASVVNHKSKSYAGEEYEDMYINAFNALNYYNKDKYESAMVEVRRMSEKLKFVNDKNEALTAILDEKENHNAKKTAEKLGVPLYIPPNFYRVVLGDSALGRYLSMLFYLHDKKYDDARIDYEAIETIFANARNVYNFPVPESVKEEMTVNPNFARLNVIAFSGLSPIKEAEARTLQFDDDFKIQYTTPKLLDRPSIISSIEVEFDNGGKYEMKLLENISAVQAELMRFALETVMKETTARLLVKAVPSAIAYSVGKNLTKNGAGVGAIVGVWMWLGGTLGGLSLSATEHADTRATHYFPGKAYINGIWLKPGVYSFKVNFYSSDKIVASVPFNNVQINAGELNLYEAYCLK